MLILLLFFMDVTSFLSSFSQNSLVRLLDVPIADAYFVFLVLPLVFLVLALYFYFVKKDVKTVKVLLLSLLLAGVLSIALKSIYHEARPCAGLLECNSDFGFPSSHASVTFAIAFALIGTEMFLPALIFALYASIMRVLTGLHSFPQIVAGAVLGVISAILIRDLLIKNLEKVKQARNESIRQVVHFLSAVFGIALFYVFDFEVAVLILSVVLIAGIVLFSFVQSNRLSFLVKRISHLERSGDLIGRGALSLCLGVMFTLLFSRPLQDAFAVVAILAVADAASTIIGVRFGTRKFSFNSKKSIQGTAAFIVAGFIAGSLFVPMEKAFVLAAVLAVVEILPLRVDDNLSIPIVGSLLTLIL